MKIAFVSAARSSHTIKWVNALAKKGHEVHLYSLRDHENTLKNIDDRVEIVYLKYPGFKGYFTNAAELRQKIAEFSPDIINAHYASGYGTLIRLAKVHPLLLSVWGSDVYDFPLKSAIHKYLVNQNLKKADAVASTSYVMADQVRKLFHYEKPIFITPFGVDCNLFSPKSVEKKGFCVGTVKALETKYGINYLIRAFGLLVQKMPEDTDLRLLIYGKGSKREELQQLIDHLGLSEKAKLCGAVPNTQVPELINEMDVLCLPSILNSESFGVAAVEAMACAVPVVASDVDGFRATVEDGVTGYVVPKQDAQIIADKLYGLAVNPSLREKLGKAGRERVLRLYDFEKNVDEMEDCYRKTIKLFEEKNKKK